MYFFRVESFLSLHGLLQVSCKFCGVLAFLWLHVLKSFWTVSLIQNLKFVTHVFPVFFRKFKPLSILCSSNFCDNRRAYPIGTNTLLLSFLSCPHLVCSLSSNIAPWCVILHTSQKLLRNKAQMQKHSPDAESDSSSQGKTYWQGSPACLAQMGVLHWILPMLIIIIILTNWCA